MNVDDVKDLETEITELRKTLLKKPDKEDINGIKQSLKQFLPSKFFIGFVATMVVVNITFFKWVQYQNEESYGHLEEQIVNFKMTVSKQNKDMQDYVYEQNKLVQLNSRLLSRVETLQEVVRDEQKAIRQYLHNLQILVSSSKRGFDDSGEYGHPFENEQ